MDTIEETPGVRCLPGVYATAVRHVGFLLAAGLLLGCALLSETVAAPPPGLYWSDGGADKIRLSGLDGLGGTDLISSDIINPQQVALTATHLYYADSNGGKLVRSDFDGSNVTVIRSGISLPQGVAVVDAPGTTNDRIYWSELGPPGAIRSARLTGGGLVTHATNLSFPQGIALTDSHVYWADLLTKKVQRVAWAGTGQTVEDLVTEADGLDDPIAVTIDGDHLYWGDSGTNKIQRSTLEGEMITDIVTASDGVGVSFPRGLSVGGGFIFWTEGTNNKIRRARLDGSAAIDILSDVDARYLVAVPPEPAIGVYTAGTGGGGIRYRVERTDMDGSDLTRIYDTSGARSRGLHLTDFHVYWADSLQNRIFRAEFDGSDPVEIMSGLTEPPQDLSVTDSHIYWTTFSSSEIKRAGLDGSSPAVIRTTDTWPGSLATFDEKLYWTERLGAAGAVIRRADIEGGPSEDFISASTNLIDFDVSTNGIFWTDSGIWTADPDGNAPRRIVDQVNPSVPSAIAATETHVFWDEGGGVYAARIDGSGRRFIATATGATSIEASHPPAIPGIYWTRKSGRFSSSVRRANFDGSGVVDVITGLSNPAAVAVDDFYIFWSEQEGQGVTASIGRAYHDGSHAEKIVTTGLTRPTDIACNGSLLFWAENSSGIIEGAKLDGSSRSTRVSGLQGVTSVEVEGGHLYFLESAAGRIVRSSDFGFDRRELVTGLLNPIGLDVTNRHLYWTDHVADSVSMANLDGSNRQTVRSNLPTPSGVVAVGPALYWTELIENRIQMRSASGRVSNVYVDDADKDPFRIDAWGNLVLPSVIITRINLAPNHTDITLRVDNFPESGGTFSLFRSRVLSNTRWDPILGFSTLPIIGPGHAYRLRFGVGSRSPEEFYRVGFRSNP